MRAVFWIMLTAVVVAACARSATMPLAQDTVQIATHTAPICGPTAAQNMAVRQASVETIRRGYDRFVILAGQAGRSVVGHTPVVVQGMGGGAFVGYGGAPMVAREQGIVVKMFREGDPAGSNAISARETLGPRWQEIATKTTLTCLDE